jgi:hypothetical protein
MADSTAIAVTDRRRSGPRPRLTGEDMSLILRLRHRGCKLREIARLVSTEDRIVSEETVGQFIRRTLQPNEELQIAMAAGRAEMLDHWMLAAKRGSRDGRHAPAKDWLVATGTVSPQQHGDRVIVVIGTGTADTHSLPTLPARVTPAP